MMKCNLQIPLLFFMYLLDDMSGMTDYEKYSNHMRKGMSFFPYGYSIFNTCLVLGQ